MHYKAKGPKIAFLALTTFMINKLFQNTEFP
jgi:hypothetical protein